ncbi:hypothetical protein [Thiothrix subterranea]|uniref:hypothetical protein n=1 Tax=Thiothrix subterranea TaxID=2735563 RepID=UPI00280A4EFD|nr:hypothetical protein [Thiothrix subterranea]
MLRNKRLLAIALVVSTACSYYLFASPKLWDSAPTNAALNQLPDASAPLESAPSPTAQSNTAMSPETISSTIPNKSDAIAPTNAAETSINHDFNVVSAEVLALEQQYREGKLPISTPDEVDFSPMRLSHQRSQSLKGNTAQGKYQHSQLMTSTPRLMPQLHQKPPNSKDNTARGKHHFIHLMKLISPPTLPSLPKSRNSKRNIANEKPDNARNNPRIFTNHANSGNRHET